jgi:hypothetical protein
VLEGVETGVPGRHRRGQGYLQGGPDAIRWL